MLLAAFDPVGSETNEGLTRMRAIYKRCCGPLSVLQAGNGAMFAASLHYICPTPGLDCILCYICAVLCIELFWLYFFPLLTFHSSLLFLLILWNRAIRNIPKV